MLLVIGRHADIVAIFTDRSSSLLFLMHGRRWWYPERGIIPISNTFIDAYYTTAAFMYSCGPFSSIKQVTTFHAILMMLSNVLGRGDWKLEPILVTDHLVNSTC